MNIRKAVDEYILEHQSIKDCLSEKMINYSSLARKIRADVEKNLGKTKKIGKQKKEPI